MKQCQNNNQTDIDNNCYNKISSNQMIYSKGSMLSLICAIHLDVMEYILICIKLRCPLLLTFLPHE